MQEPEGEAAVGYHGSSSRDLPTTLACPLPHPPPAFFISTFLTVPLTELVFTEQVNEGVNKYHRDVFDELGH